MPKSQRQANIIDNGKTGMNFWENVDDELKYKGMTRKELAKAAGFNVSNIANGIRDGNVPSVETAFRISDYLGVSLKYLLTGSDIKEDDKSEKEEFIKFKKYRPIVDALETMNENIRTPIINMILSIVKN